MWPHGSFALDKFQSRVPQCEQAIPVDPSAAAAVGQVKQVAQAANAMSGVIGTGVAMAAKAVGTAAASSLGSAPTTAAGAALLAVGSASLHALSSVAEALDESAVALASKGAEVTSDAVGHKYGEGAARVTATGLQSVGQAALAARNVSCLGKKALATAVAKSAVAAAAHSCDTAAVNVGECGLVEVDTADADGHAPIEAPTACAEAPLHDAYPRHFIPID